MPTVSSTCLIGSTGMPMPLPSKPSHTLLSHCHIQIHPKPMNTGIQCQKYTPLAPDMCPTCLTANETTAHILTCPSIRAAEILNLSFDILKDSLSLADTFPLFFDTWIHGLSLYINGLDSHAPTCPCAPTSGSLVPIHCLLSQTYIDQSIHIIWYQFLHERISKLRTQAIAKHYQLRKSPLQCNNCAQQVISNSWNHAFQQWEFQNGALHGHNLAKQQTQLFTQVYTTVKDLYLCYLSDPSTVLAHQRHLFTHILPLKCIGSSMT